MDLYSAARRMNRPFVFDAPGIPELSIGARGIIGDGFTAGLVRADGVIDWLCFPRFDSPSVCAGILDPANGGTIGITPTARPFTSLQRYDPNTNVLETLFEVPGQGAVRLTDYMPWTDDPRASVHELHRRIQCVEGEVDMELVFDPRFDYGRATTEIELSGGGALAKDGAGNTLGCAVTAGLEWRRGESGSGVRAVRRMRAGERRWMVVSWGAPRCEPIAAYRPFEHLRSTRVAWRNWVHGLEYDGPWRHHVIRAALVLKLLQYAPTGAMVAAPTTSLPEWLGGVRNWDYRYSWSRDSAMAIRAASLIGTVREARDYFHFVRDTLQRDRELHIMYTIQGERVPEEQTLAHLAGFRGSGPVRVGNGARDQLQLDTSGAVLDAAFVYERGGGSLSVAAWRKLRDVVEDVAARWRQPDHGIWEPRHGVHHNTHSKLMSWVALRRGSVLAPLFGDDALVAPWNHAAEEIHADICAHGHDPERGHFVASYGQQRADSALLLLPLMGFLPADDPRITRTIDWVRAELGTGPFLHRYRTEEDDGVGGHEGAFVLCGFWLAEALAMAGRIDEAQDVFHAHAESSNHLGLLAEELDPADGEPLGNFPQAFSHLGLINAAARIDLALRISDEGSTRAPLHFQR